MDDRDRHIISFGDDNGTDDFNIADYDNDDYDIDVNVTQEVEPEVHPYAEEAGPEEPSEPDYTPPEQTYTEPLHVRPVNERRYVTKGALVLCMILTMIVSSMLGAFLGANLSRSSDNSQSQSLDSKDLSQLSLSDATDGDLTIAEIVKKNENAVVEILVSGTARDFFGQMQVTEGAGSGVIINDKGYIVTNYHVIQGANKVQVTLHNGETYPATIVGGSNENDIAVIKINATGLTVAEIGDSSTINVGDTAVAIGNPLGQLGGTATTGIISALDRRLTIDGRTLNLIQTDAAINGGNSGGGLFNSKGELIGIVDAKSSGVGIEGLAFAIPINSVADIINDLVENGKVSAKPAIGIMIQEVSKENAEYYNLESEGVYVARVTGENAQNAGFQQGDRIVSFNGNEIKSSSDLISRVRECKAGDTATVVISRSGQQIEIKTVLEESTATE
ncbi:MAG: trypsin-like peptidase domain-containing protein [Mogibacterium sp.]|nr:trypsin-like peptidase domain-containing protein [Mogibacterium sp.]